MQKKRNRKKVKFLLYYILFFLGSIGWSETQYTRNPNSIPVYECHEVPDNSINIDGKLNEPYWHKFPELTFSGLTNDNLPLYKGSCVLLWDSDYLYAGYYLTEPDVFALIQEIPKEGSRYEAQIMDTDPFVKFFLDPDGDGLNYIEIHVNPANAVADLLLKNPSAGYSRRASGIPIRKPPSHVHLWECFFPGLKTAVHIDGTLNNNHDVDRGWSVEIAIPWRTIQKYTPTLCPPANVETWRCHVGRIYRRVPREPRTYWTWPVFDVFHCHIPAQWGILRFIPFEGEMKKKKDFNRDVCIHKITKLTVKEKNQIVITADRRLFHQYNIIALCRFEQLLHISTADCKAAGISKIFFYIGNPIIINKNNRAAWKDTNFRDKLFQYFKKFEKDEISLVPLTAFFYEKNPARAENSNREDMLQLSRWSKQKKFRCFTSNIKRSAKRLKFLISELKKFSNFTAICLDDEPGVIDGGCVCRRCKKLFRQKYNIPVPEKSDYLKLKKGIVSNICPVILWNKFQRDNLKNFYTRLCKAAKDVEPDLSVFTIPAAAYYAGKQLSIKNCSAQDFFHARKILSLDPTNITDYQLYVQFHINRINPCGWDEKYADGLCCAMSKGLPNFCNIPIYDVFDKKAKIKLISIPAFRRFILETFAEGSRGIVYFPYGRLSEKHRKEAARIYREIIKPVMAKTGRLKRVFGKVGIFYSTTSRQIEDIWRKNPIERYKQLHACDAIAYYLKKRGIPFEIIREDYLTNRKELQYFRSIILPDVNYITSENMKLLRAYIRVGGQIIINKNSSVHIPGAKEISFNAAKWYHSIIAGEATDDSMKKQYHELDKIFSKLLPNSLAICYSLDNNLNINYQTDGKNIYLFLVNDSLRKKIQTVINFNDVYNTEDILNGNVAQNIDKLSIEIEAANIKILKLIPSKNNTFDR